MAELKLTSNGKLCLILKINTLYNASYGTESYKQ